MEIVTSISTWLNALLKEIALLDPQLILLALLVVCAVIVIDKISLFVRAQRNKTGIGKHAQAVSVDGGSQLTSRHYVSEMQGLAGRPDALLREEGFIIPVERKPLANKLRDRYVAQLLVYMRLIEEFEGRRPPYGYLILGPSCRKIKIENSPQRQAWLQGMIDEMQGILAGKASVPTPHPRKCRQCDVRAACAFSIAPKAEEPQEQRGSAKSLSVINND